MRLFRKLVFGSLTLAGVLGLLALPATTRQGVDYRVTEKRIPLLIKGADFLVRSYEYRQLAAEQTRGLSDDEAIAEALMRWTREQIRPVPPDWPVVDDHISHILIRGYGTVDQRADVFTTLATYAGVPAFWRGMRDGPKPGHWIVSFVKIRGRWTAWDIVSGTAFRDGAGNLMSVEQLGWDRFSPPEILRPEKQMPLRRILYELRKAGKKLLGRPVNPDE